MSFNLGPAFEKDLSAPLRHDAVRKGKGMDTTMSDDPVAIPATIVATGFGSAPDTDATTDATVAAVAEEPSRKKAKKSHAPSEASKPPAPSG